MKSYQEEIQAYHAGLKEGTAIGTIVGFTLGAVMVVLAFGGAL